MDYSGRHRLFDPAPMALEMGFERSEQGVLHVAIRTDMHRCTGSMFEWWFRFRPETREYVWWHPHDHVASRWDEAIEGTHIGSIHQVVESFTGGEPEALAIQFRDPTEFFEPSALETARASGALSGLICARGGPGPTPQRDEQRRVIGTRLIHLCRDTPWGMVLRTHFFLGQDLPAVGVPRPALEQLFPDDLGPRLLQHCYDEFTTLSRFLPSLYAAENRHVRPVTRPW